MFDGREIVEKLEEEGEVLFLVDLGEVVLQVYQVGCVVVSR